MGQKADHREQIYRNSEEDKGCDSETAEGWDRGCDRGKTAEEEADEVVEEVAEEVAEEEQRRKEGGRGGRRTAYLNHKTTHRGSGTTLENHQHNF